MTRSLHVVESLDERMGGSVRAALDVCRALTERGHEATLVGTTTSEDHLAYLGEGYAALPYYLFKRRFPRHYFRAPGLRRWLKANVRKFDIVEIHSVFSFVPLYTATACQDAGVPYLVRPHGSLEPYDLRKHAQAKKVYGSCVVRQMLARAERVVLATKQEADRLRTFGASPAVEVVPLPVYEAGHTGDAAAFRERYAIPAEALVVLFMGRLDQKKGLQFLLPALATLKKSIPHLWFVMAGSADNSTSAGVDDLITRNGMDAWTIRCGFLSGTAKQSALAAGDIFALPSLNENFGIAVVEALYAGMPVVVSDQVYIHDVVVGGGAGVQCEPSQGSCEQALRTLLEEAERRREMGERARALAKSHFAPEVSTSRLLSLYAEVLGS